MRRLALVLLASALAVAAIDGAQADSLQVAPKKHQKYQNPYDDTYPTLHGRSYSSNSLPDPGSDNRYYSDTLNSTSIQGPAFTANGGGWTVLPCRTDVFGCF